MSHMALIEPKWGEMEDGRQPGYICGLEDGHDGCCRWVPVASVPADWLDRINAEIETAYKQKEETQ